MKNVLLKMKVVPHKAWTQISNARMLAIVLSTIFIFGCAHTPAPAPKCSGVSFHSPTEIDACTGENGIKVGDRVAFLKPQCSTPTRGNPKKCTNIKVGGGSVTKILDEHLSTIKLDSQFEVTGTTVLELEK